MYVLQANILCACVCTCMSVKSPVTCKLQTLEMCVHKCTFCVCTTILHTFSCCSVLSALSFAANSLALSASTSPISRPSSTTDKEMESDGRGPPRGFIPREVRRRGRWVVLGVAVVTRQAAARWFSSPQGAPSGVCTGHRKPVGKRREGTHALIDITYLIATGAATNYMQISHNL